MSQELTHEQLRDLARRVGAALPGALSYALIVWPPNEPTDVAYFSNSHRSESVVALGQLLGTLTEG